ncbi:MAG TPA: MFS transporter [Candidatus Limnocylindria bacterium]
MESSRRWTSPSAGRPSPTAPALRRRDASLYIVASALGGLGLGIAIFYLNFLYRAIGLDNLAIGALSAAQALGALAGAIPATVLARRVPRRSAILAGGVITGAGIVGVLLFDAFGALLLSALFVGTGGIVVSSSGSALVADATIGTDRAAMFGRQTALSALAYFIATSIAGALAAPVSQLLGRPEASALVIRALIATGGTLAIASAVPILFVRPSPVASGTLEAPVRRRLLARFAAIEACFGFGAGSFLPFLNLFFADRFGLSFAAIGVLLGVLAVAGSIGALVHARYAVPRLGTLRAVVTFELASLPFAIAAALAGSPALAVAALAVRAALMYGAAPTFTSFQLSSFTPAERAGASALLTITWNAANASGASLSGLIRATAGPPGYTVNLVTLAGAYCVAALLTVALFRAHEPRGDPAGAV